MPHHRLNVEDFDIAQYLEPPAHPYVLLAKIFFYGTASGISTGFVPAWLYSMLTTDYQYIIYGGCVVFGLFIMHSLYVKIAFQIRFAIRGETEKIKNNVLGQRVIRASALICGVITTFAGMQKFLNVNTAETELIQDTAQKIEQLETEKNNRVAEYNNTIAFYESIGRVTYYAQPERHRRDAYIDSMNAVINMLNNDVNFARVEMAGQTDYTQAIRYFSFGIEFLYVFMIIGIGLVWYFIIDESFVTESQAYSAYVYATMLKNQQNRINQATINNDNGDNLKRDNDATTVNVSSKSGSKAKIGNSFGVDFENLINQAILGAIKNEYGRIKATGGRISFTDIGNKPNIDRSRQYVQRVKDAAIEEGLLPADFMKQFEGM